MLLFLILSPYLPFAHYRMRDEQVTWINLPKGAGEEFGTAFKKSIDLPKTTIQQQKKPVETIVPAVKKPSMTYESKKQKGKKLPEAKKKTEEEERMEKVLAKAKEDVNARKGAIPEAAQIPNEKSGGVASGTTTGSRVALGDPELILYKEKIKKKILDEWILPLKFQDPSLGLICTLDVFINDRGELIETRWVQKSGNEVFDLSALRAVQKAAPLEPPPERLKWEALNEGFEFEFKPQAKTF